MAKNKRRGPKPRNVFHIASQKHFKVKSKAKPVTTNLKKVYENIDIIKSMEREPALISELKYIQEPLNRADTDINIVNDDKVNRMNKAFVDIQKVLTHFSKGLSLEPVQKPLIPQQCHENEAVNVDEATKLMAQL